MNVGCLTDTEFGLSPSLFTGSHCSFPLMLYLIETKPENYKQFFCFKTLGTFHLHCLLQVCLSCCDLEQKKTFPFIKQEVTKSFKGYILWVKVPSMLYDWKIDVSKYFITCDFLLIKRNINPLQFNGKNLLLCMFSGDEQKHILIMTLHIELKYHSSQRVLKHAFLCRHEAFHKQEFLLNHFLPSTPSGLCIYSIPGTIAIEVDRS